MSRGSAQRAVDHIFLLSLLMPDCYKTSRHHKSKYGPGQYVLTRNEELRRDFQALKSDDLANIRPDLAFGLSPDESAAQGFRERNREMLLKFDREVLGL